MQEEYEEARDKAADEAPKAYENKYMNADTPRLSGAHYLTFGFKMGSDWAWAKAQDEIELNEQIIKSKTQSLYEMSQIKRQYESNIKSLQQRADKLAEAIKRLNRVRNAAVFADSETQITAMFHELDQALAEYRGEKEGKADE